MKIRWYILVFNFQIMKHQLILFQILQVSSVLPKSLSLRHNALNCLSVLGLVLFFLWIQNTSLFSKHSCPMADFQPFFYSCKHSFGWLTPNRSQRVSDLGSYLPRICSSDYLCSSTACPLWSLYEICFRGIDITKPTKRTWVITRHPFWGRSLKI